MKSITLGKYVPFDSLVHRIDPRVKILATICLLVAIFLPLPTYSMSFLVEGILFLLILVALLVSRVRFSDILISLRSLWILIIFLLLVYIVVPKQENVLGVAWNLNGWIVYWDAFAEAGKIILRLVMMIMVTMILTSTTKPLDLTYALEWYMTPLKAFHFPSAEVAMTISIALRFIPTLLEDANRVMKAQASRGVDFMHSNIVAKITGLTSLIVPLFVSSFLRSEELANAMECRGYDPRLKRTRYRILRFRVRDIVAMLLVALILAGVIVLVATKVDVFALVGVHAL